MNLSRSLLFEFNLCSTALKCHRRRWISTKGGQALGAGATHDHSRETPTQQQTNLLPTEVNQTNLIIIRQKDEPRTEMCRRPHVIYILRENNKTLTSHLTIRLETSCLSSVSSRSPVSLFRASSRTARFCSKSFFILAAVS